MFRSVSLPSFLILLLMSGHLPAAERSKVIAEGQWSEPVADNRGFAVRGRLVLCERVIAENRREAAVYIELADASEHVGGSMQVFCDLGKTDFRPEYKSGLACELFDKDKKPVALSIFAFSGAMPGSLWMPLPSDATIRLRASPFGVHRPGALAISLPSQLWVIEGDDKNEYFLSGTFTVDPPTDRPPPGDGQVWRGTIELPALRIGPK